MSDINVYRGEGAPGTRSECIFTHTQHPEQEVIICCPATASQSPLSPTLGWKLQEKASEGCLIASGRDNVSLVQSCFMARDWRYHGALVRQIIYKTWNNYKHKIFLVLFPLN